jgi:hypothetical protein
MALQLECPHELVQACAAPLRKLRTFLVWFARCASRSEEEPGAEHTSVVMRLGGEQQLVEPSLLSRMHELHARGEEELYA